MAKRKPSKKNPRGGLSAYGRKTSKGNLKPGVKGKADTPEKKRRKGSFLARHYGGPAKKLKDSKGRPTRHAKQARAWGEPAPTTQAKAKKLAAKGRRLLKAAKKRKPRKR